MYLCDKMSAAREFSLHDPKPVVVTLRETVGRTIKFRTMRILRMTVTPAQSLEFTQGTGGRQLWADDIVTARAVAPELDEKLRDLRFFLRDDPGITMTGPHILLAHEQGGLWLRPLTNDEYHWERAKWRSSGFESNIMRQVVQVHGQRGHLSMEFRYDGFINIYREDYTGLPATAVVDALDPIPPVPTHLKWIPRTS